MDGTYNIIYDGDNVGKLKVSSQGLMTVFSGETKHINGILRLAVISEGKSISIGILSPSDKGLMIKKSFTKNSLAELGVASIDKVILLASEAETKSAWVKENEPSSLFSDPDLRQACRGARGVLSMQKGDVTEIAFPVGSRTAFSLMPAFCIGRPNTISGKDYLIFKIKDGNIVEQ